jgi:hypothetical protein
LIDAALREGEVFHDNTSGLSVRVTAMSDDLVTIDVSTHPFEEWSVSERIKFSEGVNVRDVYLTTAEGDFYDDETTFAAVVVEGEYDPSLRIYSSSDNGRDWVFMFDTNETEYQIYTFELSFCYYQEVLMLTGTLYDLENSFFGVMEYSISSDSFSYINFTEMVNQSLYEVSSSAGPDSYYAGFVSRWNGTMGISYFKLNNTGWSFTFVPVPELLDIRISNVPPDGTEPYVLYRDGYHHLRLVRFNQTSIIHNVTSEYDGVWNIDVVCSSEQVAISYLDGPSSGVFDLYTVEVGSPIHGFSKVILVNRSEYLRPVLLSYNNMTDEFRAVLSISGNLTLFNIAVGSVEDQSIDIEGASSYCYSPRIGYSTYQLLLVRTGAGYDMQSISSITWIHSPLDPTRVIAYYQGTSSRLILPISSMPMILLGSIIIIYLVLNSDKATMKIRCHLPESRLERLKTLKSHLISAYSNKTTNLRPFFLSTYLLCFNVVLAVLIFHLAMQIPFVNPGTWLSIILHDIGRMNLLDPVSIMIIITMLIASLIYLVELDKPVFYVKVFIWIITFPLVLFTPLGISFGLFLIIITLLLWIPIWGLTGFEIKHTKSTQLYKIAVDSLSSIETPIDELHL